jgi:hypothetical protein
MLPSQPAPFLKTTVAAFPPCMADLAMGAAQAVAPFVDETYHSATEWAIVLGRTVKIPKRIHFVEMEERDLRVESNFLPAIQCLRTRSADGFTRQASLRQIVGVNEPWAIPFVVLLAGEYVVEIIEDMVVSLSSLNRNAYVNFVRENRPLMRLLRARAISYWERYYRETDPDRSTYPGLAFLHRLETWAS